MREKKFVTEWQNWDFWALRHGPREALLGLYLISFLSLGLAAQGFEEFKFSSKCLPPFKVNRKLP